MGKCTSVQSFFLSENLALMVEQYAQQKPKYFVILPIFARHFFYFFAQNFPKLKHFYKTNKHDVQ